ncbi:MAG TPA: phosphoribosyltransferase family protein [Nitrososphaeraceae archaeon]
MSSIRDGSILRFKNREKAAYTLASVIKDSIRDIPKEEILVLGIPRGGVIMASIISQKIGASLFDIVIPRKLTAPNNPELGVGAIMVDGTLYLNEYVVNALKVTEEYLEMERQRQIAEIRRRESVYRKNARYYDIRDKVIILVDDGAATGATLVAASRWIRKQKPKSLVIAIPVVPKETLELLKKESDDVQAVIVPSTTNFRSVGQYYEDFDPVTDEEVAEIMGRENHKQSK